MKQQKLLNYTEEPTIEEEDVLDNEELNRIAHRAEHPELEDPVFLFIPGNKRGGAP